MRFKREKAKISITLVRGLVRVIDKVRGPLPRSNFIQMLIEEGLKTHGAQKPGGGSIKGEG